MKQIIESALLEEFETELNKLEEIKSKNPIISKNCKSEALGEFWQKFLTSSFPNGAINKILEKNFAVWICQNKIDVPQVVEKYRLQGWRPEGLLGWIKKVSNGEINSLNILELLQWSNDNGKFEVELLEKAKSELSEALPIETAPDIIQKPDTPITWIVEPFIRPKSISFLSSPAGKGKTWTALLIGLTCSNGYDFLGKFKTNTSSVLYLDYENYELLKPRLTMLVKGLGKPASNFANLHVLSTPIKFNALLPSLKKTIKENGYQLLIVDTLREATDFDENDSKQVSRFIGDLRTLIQETGIAILLLHHEGKGHLQGEDMNRLRGSTALTGCADCIIQLKNNDGENITFIQSKSRGARAVEPFYCTINSIDNLSYSLTYSGLAYELEGSKGSIFFNTWIKDNSIIFFSSSEFINACSIAGISKRTATRCLSRLASEGKIRKESDKPRAKWEVYGAESQEHEIVKVESKNKKWEDKHV